MALHLDSRTIVFLGSALAVIMAVAMVLFSLSLRQHRGPGYWAAGVSGMAISSLLIALQPVLPHWLGMVGATTGIMVSLCLVCQGVAVFLGERPKWRFYEGLCLFTLLGFAYFTLLRDYFPGREVVFSLANGLLLAHTALVLRRNQADRREPTYLFVMACLLLPLAVLLLRLVVALAAPVVLKNILSPHPLAQLSLVSILLGTAGLLLGLMMLASSRFARQLEKGHAQLAQANRDLERLSTQDGLTGISNRRYLDQYLAGEFRRARRLGSPLAVILLDLDHFKLYNDSQGHQAGDDCLRRVAQALAGALRRPADLAARYGGEEFAAVLPHTGLQGAAALAESLRRAVRGLDMPHPASPGGGPVSVSLGVAALAPQDADPASLLARADQALYQSKAQGRDRVTVLP